MMHIFFFNPSLTNNNIKFVKFPKGIDVARQERLFGHIFSQTHDKIMFIDIKFTSGLNQNIEQMTNIYFLKRKEELN